MNDVLKPCPFCGKSVCLEVVDQNEMEFIGEDDDRYERKPYYTVVCSVNEHSLIPIIDWTTGCGASGGFRPTKKEAIEAWNRRTNDT